MTVNHKAGRSINVNDYMMGVFDAQHVYKKIVGTDIDQSSISALVRKGIIQGCRCGSFVFLSRAQFEKHAKSVAKNLKRKLKETAEKVVEVVRKPHEKTSAVYMTKKEYDAELTELKRRMERLQGCHIHQDSLFN